MPTQNLIDAYKWQRQQIVFASAGRAKIQGAFAAWLKARKDVADNVKRYPATSGAAVSWQEDKPGFAWIENTKAAGLRLVGFADEILRRLGHTGWFIDDSQDEIYRGAVWQLTGRKGAARYVAGYADPNNDAAAFVDLSPIIGDKLTSSYDDDDGKWQAARNADSIAESCAESERNYQSAWQAGNAFSEASEARDAAKAELRELLAERRGARSVIEKADWGGAFARAVDKQARDLIKTRRESFKRMQKLASGDGIGRDCFASFWPGDATLRAAFCYGASLSSFPDL